ncbi:hypothetical protein HYPSUDRAFT_204606 [Hypholoma sublateritium FD-334 SS-4]|uniref:Uncharacterized protein n=1 Tax=Hypholoma sublateritium (strain FD-334 SS-4) TaxID=945553 RepID=A0A0D2NKG8_HYPSF|nr:hypothetical protein HYPSUDRAFT_204606 [Hypholoma sublateritium FD-334 SS-4]
MTRMLTTWQDLAALGWSIPRVYDKLNAKRGNTMDEMGQLSLNDGPALGSNGWYCYNDFKGDPHPQTPTYTSTTTEEVVWDALRLKTCGLADNPNDRIGTTGTKWDGSTNWAYSVNAALDNPSKRMIISSTLYKDRYTFRLENITADINSTSSETEVGDTDEWAEW